MEKLLLGLVLVLIGCSLNSEAKEKSNLISFREFLVQNNIKKDLKTQNKFETLNDENSYSNHYFNFSTRFPISYSLDRGNEEFTVLRGFDTLTSATVSVNVRPLKLNHDEFQKAPLTLMEKIYEGNYRNYVLETFASNANIEITELEISEHKIRSTNYIVTTARYEETYDSINIPIALVSYSTYDWGNYFTFSYTTPEMFFDSKMFSDILIQTNYIR